LDKGEKEMRSNITNNIYSDLFRKGFTFLFICCSFGSIKALNVRNSISSRKNRTELRQIIRDEVYQGIPSNPPEYLNAEIIDSVDPKTNQLANYIYSFNYLKTYQINNLASIEEFYHNTDIPPWI
jgi:hypothetical protein